MINNQFFEITKGIIFIKITRGLQVSKFNSNGYSYGTNRTPATTYFLLGLETYVLTL